ncbi:MAG: hypothetical protein DYG98_17970 [Haliscomenobacteraceae bacterium CHB4]|nr:hypothetical protein [Saprospiraceae bacterium]MCE7924943.1 hypothetical protein [Haliscomenobacteraceae bacterium CHB4]
MQNSTLLQTLRLFTQAEIERLHLFVDSPIFNEANRFHDKKNLFEYLKPHYPEFDTEVLKKEIVAQKLFGERKNSVLELEKAMSQLMRIVRQFIHFQYFAVKGSLTSSSDVREEESTGDLTSFARQQLALMRFYSERLHQHPNATYNIAQEKTDTKTEKGKTPRHVENFFLNQYRKLKEALARQSNFSQYDEYDFNDILYFRFLLEQEKALFDSLSDKRAGDDNLLVAIEELDKFYLLTKLDMMSRLSHQEKLALPYPPDSQEYQRLNYNREITLLLLDFLNQKNYMLTPGIQMYSALLHFLTLDDSSLADQAADLFDILLREYGHSITASRVSDFKIMLRAHWARRYRQTRDLRFVERIFNLQTDQLQNMKPHEFIPASHLLNIVLTSLKLLKLEKAEQILLEYEHRITGTNQPDICRALWWAMVRLAQKRYAEAAQTLPHYYVYGDFGDFQMYAIAMLVNVKICYELDTLEDEQGINMVRATTKRIKEDTTMKPHDREAHLHFAKYAREIFKLKMKKRLKNADINGKLDALRTEIAAAHVIEKEWLLEKCGELATSKTGNK